MRSKKYLGSPLKDPNHVQGDAKEKEQIERTAQNIAFGLTYRSKYLQIEGRTCQ